MIRWHTSIGLVRLTLVVEVDVFPEAEFSSGDCPNNGDRVGRKMATQFIHEGRHRVLESFSDNAVL